MRAAHAGRKRSRLITYFFIVALLLLFGGHFLKECGVAWCFPGLPIELVGAWRASPFHGRGLVLWRIIPFSLYLESEE